MSNPRNLLTYVDAPKVQPKRRPSRWEERYMIEQQRITRRANPRRALRFLDLPREIRNDVYQCLFDDDDRNLAPPTSVQLVSTAMDAEVTQEWHFLHVEETHYKVLREETSNWFLDKGCYGVEHAPHKSNVVIGDVVLKTAAHRPLSSFIRNRNFFISIEYEGKNDLCEDRETRMHALATTLSGLPVLKITIRITCSVSVLWENESRVDGDVRVMLCPFKNLLRHVRDVEVTFSGEVDGKEYTVAFPYETVRIIRRHCEEVSLAMMAPNVAVLLSESHVTVRNLDVERHLHDLLQLGPGLESELSPKIIKIERPCSDQGIGEGSKDVRMLGGDLSGDVCKIKTPASFLHKGSFT